MWLAMCSHDAADERVRDDAALVPAAVLLEILAKQGSKHVQQLVASV